MNITEKAIEVAVQAIQELQFGPDGWAKVSAKVGRVTAGAESITVTLPPQEGMTTKPKTINTQGGRWDV